MAFSSTAPRAASTADLKVLLNQLQDDTKRRALIAEIQALIAVGDRESPAPAPAASSPITSVAMIDAASDGIRKASDALVGAAGMLLDVPRLSNWLGQRVSEPDTRDLILGTLLRLAGMLGFALAAERMAALLLAARSRPAAEASVVPPWLGAAYVLGGILRDLFFVSVFAGTAYVALLFAHPRDVVRPVLLVLLIATAALRALLVIGRGILAPKASDRRLIGMNPDTGSYWYVWLRRFGVLLIGGYALADSALLVGLPPVGFDVFLKAIGFVASALLFVLILQNREAVRDWIGGHPEAERQGSFQILRGRVAEIWHVPALIYIAAIYGVWALEVPGGFAFLLRASALSAAAIAIARVLADFVERVLRRFFAIGHDLHLRFPGLEERAGRYLPVLTTSLRGALYVAAGLTVLQAWGLDSFTWLESDPGRRIAGGAATLLITIAVAVLIWETVTIVTGAYLVKGIHHGPRHLHRARAETFLPLLRSSIAIVLIVFVVLIALSALGLDIGPLLAGAGVVGIAIGLGAQSFVKDLINGLHLLLEDTFAVGDVVTIGPDTGSVEAISMRTVRLRDGNGALRTIPFSEISKVTNLTRDFAYAVFDVPIDFREDVGRAMEILEVLGAELTADPEFAPDILAPMEKPVLSRFADYALILHCQIRTFPGRQWDVQNEFNRRLKDRFDSRGIAMPVAGVTSMLKRSKSSRPDA